MDMKKILQSIDNVSTKPVEGSDSMKKFLQVVNEGANPHKVTLPVQMAMQHYQQPSVKVKPRTRLIDKYFTEAEATILQKKQEEKTLLKQYAQVIAERVLMKENYNPNASPNPGFKPGAGPGIMSSVAEDNAPDAITVDVPLMIRLMEYAREDTDTDLNDIAEKLTALSTDGKTLTMDDYESIVGNQENE